MSTQSQEIGKLAEALAKAQGEIQGAIKDATNPFFNSKYADLASTWEACRGPLSKHGLSVIQTTEDSSPSGICVVTLLAHSSGQWVRGVLPILAVKKDPQGIGSAITYARRYALAAIAGIAQIDDDGNAAQGLGQESGRPNPHAAKNMQPSPEDGHKFETKGYVINFGKWNRYTIEQIYNDQGAQQIANYITYLEKQADKDKKPLSPDAVLFISEAERFLGAMENGGAA